MLTFSKSFVDPYWGFRLPCIWDGCFEEANPYPTPAASAEARSVRFNVHELGAFQDDLDPPLSSLRELELFHRAIWEQGTRCDPRSLGRRWSARGDAGNPRESRDIVRMVRDGNPRVTVGSEESAHAM